MINATCTWFRYVLNNEIYYDPVMFINQNYNWTVHQGIQAGISARPFSLLALSGNYTYTEARFLGGTFEGKEIPAVPMHKGMISTQVFLLDFHS